MHGTVGRWMIWAHKWLGLVIGGQVLLWFGSGLYMTAVPIETVRGEHNIAKVEPSPLTSQGLLNLETVLGGGAVTRAELVLLNGLPVWRLDEGGKPAKLLNARSGAALSPLVESFARDIASADFSGKGSITAATFIEKDPPIEYRGALPVWQVQFSDEEGTRLYVSALTAKVTARRTNTWRLYDFLWGVHIMDWSKREDFNHPLVIAASALALILALSGAWLVWLRFKPRA